MIQPTARQPAGIPVGGQFTATSRARSTVELADQHEQMSDWLDGAPQDLDESESRLAAAMQRLHAISPSSQITAHWMSGDTFTCDGGALATALMARELGIPATLNVGLYWHTDADLRAEIMDYLREDCADGAEWDQTLDLDVRPFMDEHHHWTILNDGTDFALRVDPNGPERNEPYLARPGSETGTKYEPVAEYLVYDPNDDWDDLADSLYPGLREHIRQAAAST